MIIRLQVFTDGEWGTLNTRQSTSNEDDVAKVMTELSLMQSAWASNYGRFADATFRIVKEK